jgi:hypothetical protein
MCTAITYNEYKMRIIAGCLFFAFVSIIMAPSSQELRSRYGEPDVERFIVRPGIGLTVEYGSDRLACEVLIESAQPPVIYLDEEHIPFMSVDVVTQVLEEIAPANMRGMNLGESISSMGCNESKIVEYENVTINRATHNCLPLKPEREARATVTFKRDICRRSK